MKISLNDQNFVVDYHPLGEAGAYTVIRGSLATPLTIGQDEALITTESGAEQGYQVRPIARSTLAAIPVGVQAVFLLDETGKIADATFGSQDAFEQAQQEWTRKSPIKGAHLRVVGVVLKPLSENQITVRTEGGQQRPFDVRQMVREKLSKLEEGQPVIVLLDHEEQVIDVAIPPGVKG